MIWFARIWPAVPWVAFAAFAATIGVQPLPALKVVPATPELGFAAREIGLPVLLLLAAVGVALVAGRAQGASARASLVVGAVVGLLAALFVALAQTVALALRTDYVRGVYRAWALVYVLAASGAVAYLAARSVRTQASGGIATASWTLAAVAVLTAAATALRGERLVAAAIAVGVATGGAVGWWAWSRVDSLVAAMTRRPVVAGALLAALTYASRLVFGLQVLASHGPGLAFAVASDDGDTYFTYASSIVTDPAKALEVAANGVYAPGYSFFLAALLWATRGEFVALIALQCVLAAVSAVLAYALVRDLAGPVPAFITGLLFAFAQNLIHVEATFTTEALLLPLVLLFVFALVRYERAPRFSWMLLAGASLSLAVFTRNVVAVFLPAALLWLAFQRPLPWRQLVGHALALVLFVVLSFAPAAYATWQLTGTPRFTNQAAALAWHITSGAWESAAPSNVSLVERGIDPFRDPSGSLARALQDPLAVAGFYLKVVPRRLLTLLLHPNYGVFDPVLIVNHGVLPNPFGTVADVLLVGSLLAGTLAAARAVGRARGAALLCLTLVAAYLVLFSVVFAPLHPIRYRVPIEPFLLFAQGVGLVTLVRIARAATSASLR